ncbi:MAG: hypothetical protein ACKOAS_07740 [Verrucomicrobiota bacterium]
MKKIPSDYSDHLARASVWAPLAELVPIKALISILGAAILLVGGYFFSLYAIHGFDRDFLAINECVESGGRWNHQLRICEKLPGIYEPPPAVPQY